LQNHLSSLGERLALTLFRQILIGLVAATLIVAAPLGTALQATTQPVPEVRPVAASHHFPDGQSFVYNVEWRLWNAGTATLQVSADTNQQHIHGSAVSTGAVALLYHVQDRFDSYFDSRSSCSSQIIKHTEEGLRRKQTEIRFDYARHRAVLDETNLRNQQKKHEEHEIPSCSTDVLSALFYAASLPLEPGSSSSFPVNDGGNTVNVTLRAEAREEIKTPAGTFKTIRVQPEASSGPRKDRGHIWVWYTDDGQHLPVQMRARMLWGTLTFRLARVEKIQPSVSSRSADK
jgi:hypothetical protein